MATYYEVLQAMEHLLDRVGETVWRDWLRDDIRRWESDQDTGHHLQAYGGAGSFNDVALWRANGYQVTEAQEEWVQGLFENLRGICFRLAQQPHTEEPLSRALSSGTRDMPIFEGFQRSDEDEGRLADLSSHLEQLSTQLHGWRCLDCGYAETSPRRIEQFLVQEVLPAAIASIGQASGLRSAVDATLALDFPGLQASRERLTTAVLGSQIHVQDRKGWVRPCPNCGSDHTAMYRWQYAAAEQPPFRPAADNLPLKDSSS